MIEVFAFSAVKKLIKEFQDNPFSFLYKTDLRSVLCSEMRNKLKEKILVPKTNGGYYDPSPVYTDYLNKIDVACLYSEQIEKIKPGDLIQHKGYDTYIYDLPAYLGIVIRYFWMGAKSAHRDVILDHKKKLTEDPTTADKIAHWMVLCFLQREKEFGIFKKTYDQEKLKQVDAVQKMDSVFIITEKEIYSYID